MPLSDAKIRTTKPGTKPIRLFDGGGLYLEVAPSGGKWWRLKYRIRGREKRLSLGVYPDVPLAGRAMKELPSGWLEGARDKRDHLRRLIAQGVDPSDERKAARASGSSNTFEAIAREWHTMQAKTLTSAHAARILRTLERDVFPWVGTRMVDAIDGGEILDACKRIEAREARETAHRTLTYCSQIMRYAVATRRVERDPCRDLRGALATPKTTHLAAITEPKRVGALLRAIDGYEGGLVVRSALRLAPLVFVRPGELRNARWVDFDLDNAEWRFTASKTQAAHIVPLSRQALVILRELQPLTGTDVLVFPGERSRARPISDNTLNAAFRRLGIPKTEMTAHGFRAMARTLLDEVLKFRPDIIEHQLAHKVRDPLGRAYNRTTHLDERKAMMQRWSDYLDELRSTSPTVTT